MKLFKEALDDGSTELDRLKEENKRLKRTLLERFDETFN
jgi:hypothetical protein